MFFKKSVALLLQMAIMVSAMAVSGMGSLEARAIKVDNIVPPDATIFERSLTPPPSTKNLNIHLKDRELKKSIDLLDAIARKEENRAMQEALKTAVQAARDVRYAVKAEVATEKQIAEATRMLDRQWRHLEVTECDCGQAVADLQMNLSNYSQEFFAKSCHDKHENSHRCGDCETKFYEIKKLPVTIRKSGHYCLARDFDLTDPRYTGAAITVTADNVDINFKNHTLTLNSALTGVAATGVSNLAVHNGTITTPTPSTVATSNAFNYISVTDASFKEMVCLNTRNGTQLAACVDQLFVNCTFDGHNFGIFVSSNGLETITVENCEFGSLIVSGGIADFTGGEGFVIHNCRFFAPIFACFLGPKDINLSNIEVSDCEFTNSSFCLTLGNNTGSFSTACQNAEIRNCRFANMPAIGINFQNCVGALVENCLLEATSSNFANLIQLDTFSPTLVVNDIIIRNCTLSNLQSAAGFDNLIMAGAQGVLVEGCIFDTNTSETGGYFPANVHIVGDFNGDSLQTSSDIKLVNCIMRNQACFGIYCDGSAFNSGGIAPIGVEIDNCLVDGALNGGIVLDNAEAVTIKDCEVTNTISGPGIFVTDGAQFNTIWNNTVVNNVNQGILIDATSSHNSIVDNIVSDNELDGLSIASSPNTAQGNILSRNGGFGINNTGGASNGFYNNSADNNTSGNYSGVPHVAAAGSPAITGGNISGP